MAYSSKNLIYLLTALQLCLASCSTRRDASWDPILQGSIDYPFGDSTKPLGVNGPEDKFVLKSQVGKTEYTIEIPKAGRDYDIEVPLEELKSQGGGINDGSDPSIGNAAATDRELEKAMPQLSGKEDRRLVELAMGVAERGGPSQSPSYSMGIAKINQHYLEKKYEFCLIEINQLLSFYPSSARLYKMKGTILLKMQSDSLAEVAWSRASELSPEDRSLSRALDKLRRRLETQAKIAESRNQSLAPYLKPDSPVEPAQKPAQSQAPSPLPPANNTEPKTITSIPASKGVAEIPRESLEGVKPAETRDLSNENKKSNENNAPTDFYY